MPRRSFTAAFALLALAATLPAAEPKPAVTAHLASVDDLLKKAEYLAGLAGQGDVVKQGAGMVRAFEDPDKGVEGFDPSRPFGLYGVVTPGVGDSYAVLVVPVKDGDAVLALLRGKLALSPVQGSDGVYAVDVPNVPVPVLFNFAHKSVYISARTPKGALAKENLLPPEKLHAEAPPGVFGVRVYLNRLPEALRTIVLGQVELRTAEAKAEPNADPEALGRELGAAATRDVLKAMMQEGATLTARVDVEEGKENILAELSFAPKSGSKLAESLRGVSERTSRFAALGGSEALASAGVRFVLPESSRTMMNAIWGEAEKKALADMKDEGKELIKPLFGVLFDTLKSGDFDAALSVTRGPESTLNGVAGLAVVGGDRAAPAVKALYEVKPPPGATIQFSTGKAGAATLHEGTVADPKYRKDTGSDKFYLGTADKFLLGSIGPDANAVQAAAGAAPAAAPLFRAEVRLAGLMQCIDGDVKKADAAKVAQKVYGGDADGRDRIRAALTAGDALTLRVDMHAQLVKFFVELDKRKKGNDD